MLNLKLKIENVKCRSTNRRNFTFYILNFTLILFSIFNFTFYIAAPAAAQIIPVPGTTCAYDRSPEECRKNICPCEGRDSEGECIEGKQLMCYSGKCGKTAADAAAANLPCNFTLDDIVLSTINVAQFIIGITGALMLLFVAYGGYQYVISMGNPEEIQKGKKILTSAFIGLILVFTATLFVRFAAGLILPAPGERGAQIPEPSSGTLPKIEIRE